ncbi:hypothetical protein Trydic_g2504 [Trypoxylus dichotomus]
MSFLLEVVILVTSILLVSIQAQTPRELLREVQKKVCRLQETGRINRYYEPYFQSNILNGEIYDFIIIGAGTASSALIRRLSEVPDWRILVLEAGGEPDIVTDIPYWSGLTTFTDLNWGYRSEKQDNFGLGLASQRMSIAKGKGIGGSSLLNFMAATRGAKEDYDKWASLGNPGWSYADVLPYFKKMENCTVRYRDDLYRGYDGPLHVEEAYSTVSGDAFIESARYNGYKYVDQNGRTNKGVSYFQTFTKRGLRCSGESCYIRPVKNRINLTIRTNSQVIKILISEKTAYGVEFYKDGCIYTAYANKEVILSGGPINSPQVLLLSGIGPKEQLLKYGIEPIHVLPVGQKMLDHTIYFGLAYTFNQSITFNSTDALRDEWFVKFFNEGEGPLRSISVAEALIFTRSPLARSKATDIEFIYLSDFLLSTEDKALVQITKELYETTYQPHVNQPIGSCLIALLHPKSYGRVELGSSDPLAHPKIYGDFFTDPGNSDLKTLILGIREAVRIMESPPFDRFGAKQIKPIRGCHHLEDDSDEYWECALRHVTSTGYHPLGTCKMGPANDPEAIVDHRLRVHGIDNLRVVDTSIIPVTVSGHTSSAAYMVGEKAADIIKEDYLSWLEWSPIYLPNVECPFC